MGVREKQIEPCVSTSRELSFEWSHHVIGFRPQTQKVELPYKLHQAPWQ